MAKDLVALRQRHVQRSEHQQLGTKMSLHRPATYPAAEGVQHDREWMVDEA